MVCNVARNKRLGTVGGYVDRDKPNSAGLVLNTGSDGIMLDQHFLFLNFPAWGKKNRNPCLFPWILFGKSGNYFDIWPCV